MEIDEWQGKAHKNRRKNLAQNTRMCVANCSCVVLATLVNYDGHFTLPTTPHARTHAGRPCTWFCKLEFYFYQGGKKPGKMRCLSYLCPCRQLNYGSWPKPLCSGLFCLHRSTGSRCTPEMSSTSQE